MSAAAEGMHTQRFMGFHLWTEGSGVIQEELETMGIIRDRAEDGEQSVALVSVSSSQK